MARESKGCLAAPATLWTWNIVVGPALMSGPAYEFDVPIICKLLTVMMNEPSVDKPAGKVDDIVRSD